MDLRSLEECKWYPEVFDQALEFEKAGEQVAVSLTKLGMARAARKQQEAREAEEEVMW